MIEGNVKALVMLGLFSLLLLVTYDQVAGGPAKAVLSPGLQIVTPALADVVQVSSRVSEYVFLHQNRDEDIRIHGMAGVLLCTE